MRFRSNAKKNFVDENSVFSSENDLNSSVSSSNIRCSARGSHHLSRQFGRPAESDYGSAAPLNGRRIR